MTRLKTLITISIFVFLYSVYYWAVPIVVDIQSRVPLIKDLIKKEIGTDTEIQSPKLKMGLIPSVWLEAKYFAIMDESKNTPLEIKNPKIKISLLPLLFREMHVAYFSCDKIKADIKFDKNYRFHIGDYLIIKKADPKLSIENSKMDISSYDLSIKDEAQNKNIKIKGDFFKLIKYTPDKDLKLSTNTQLKINDKYSIINTDIDLKLPIKKSFQTNDVTFDGTITNLNLGDIEPYLKKFSNNEIKQVSGILNIEANTKKINRKRTRISSLIVAEKFTFKDKSNIYAINFQDKLNLETSLDFTKTYLQIKKINLKSKNINMGVTGKISKIHSQNPQIDLTIPINKSRIENFIALLPNQNLKNVEIDIPSLKKYGYFSDIQGELKIKGRSDKPKIHGEILSTNGYVIRPLNIPKATVKLIFSGEEVTIDVTVPVGNDQAVYVKGPVELYGEKNSELDIRSTNKIDLETAESILLPIHEIFGFDLGPLPVINLQGTGNIELKTKGTKTSPHLFGAFNFYDTTAKIKDINATLKNASGSLQFKDTNTYFETKSASLNDQPIKIEGNCTTLGVLDYDISTSNQDLMKIITTLNTSTKLEDIKKELPAIKSANGKINANIKLKGQAKSIDDFQLAKTIVVSGKIKFLSNTILFEGSKMPIKNLVGDVSFNNFENNFNLNSTIDEIKLQATGETQKNLTNVGIKGTFKNNTFNLTGSIKDITKPTRIINANLNAETFDLSALNDLAQYPFITEGLKKYVDAITDPKGLVNIKASINNNTLYSKINMNDVIFTYEPLNLPVKIVSGTAEIKEDRLTLYKINSIADTMPVLLDGFVTNIFKDPHFNLYMHAKPNQGFVEKHINKRAIYPLKIKGDTTYTARLNGTKNSLNAKAEVNIKEASSLYYMGATLGDNENPIRLYIDSTITPQTITLNSFLYDKLISSQNHKEFTSHQLAAKGSINVNQNDINIHNLKVKTLNPTDAKIFNILFKKPIIKQGVFNSNIMLNGSVINPHLEGTLNFNGVDIPFLDTTIRDVSLIFTPDKVDIKAKGEIFSNNLIITSNMENKLSTPLVFNDILINVENLNINKIANSLNKIEFEKGKNRIIDEKQNIDFMGIIVKNGKIKSNRVFVKDIAASNLSADFSLNEKLLFSLHNFDFEAVEGKVNGNFKYNLLTSNSNLNLSVKNVDANEMASALFDLPNQIFGSLTGEVNLTCNSKTHKRCLETLNGNGGFKVINGSMPRLGSLEYLLKAANLVKSGITGLTINSIINLVAPLKTGDFKNINGTFAINSGKADSVQIFSQGDDLSLFMTGTYNFTTQIADMDIFGRLAKKVTTVLGKVGNTSLNTLFNTIPGLNLDEANNAGFIKEFNRIPGFELNDKLYRIFTVKVYGDINGENYVQSFKWVE